MMHGELPLRGSIKDTRFVQFLGETLESEKLLALMQEAQEEGSGVEVEARVKLRCKFLDTARLHQVLRAHARQTVRASRTVWVSPHSKTRYVCEKGEPSLKYIQEKERLYEAFVDSDLHRMTIKIAASREGARAPWVTQEETISSREVRNITRTSYLFQGFRLDLSFVNGKSTPEVEVEWTPSSGHIGNFVKGMLYICELMLHYSKPSVRK